MYTEVSRETPWKNTQKEFILSATKKLGLSELHIGNNWRQEMEASTFCQPKTPAHLKQLKVPRNWNLSFFAFYMYCGHQKSLGTSHFCRFACIVAIKNRWNGVHDFLKLIFLSHESSTCKAHDSWLIWMEYRYRSIVIIIINLFSIEQSMWDANNV